MFKGYRTIIWNAVFVALYTGATVVSMVDVQLWQGIAPERLWPIVALLHALANIYLRFITNTPVGKPHHEVEE